MSDEKIKQELEEAEAWAQGRRPSERTQRGVQALQQRVERARQASGRKEAISVRIDRDVLERLKTLAGPDGSYQTLLNRALIEWCDAQELGGLLEHRMERLDQLTDKLLERLDGHARAGVK